MTARTGRRAAVLRGWFDRRPRLSQTRVGRPWVEAPSRTTTVAVAAAAVLLVVAVALTVVAGQRDARDGARDEALEEGSTAVETVLSYDFRSVGTAVDDNADLVTGDFEAEYQEYVEKTLAPPVVEGRRQTTTTVAEGAVVSGDEDEVVLLLFLNQRYGVVGQEDQATSGSRVRVTVRDVDGDWRIASLDPV